MLEQDGPLSPARVLALIGGAGAALDYAWRKAQITHRDVKPGNILIGVDEAGEIESVKLADFGIAKAAGESTSLTATGTAIGTMLYVSPEVIEGREVDNRSDVYSLGCTAYHLLTGRPPYGGESLTALLSAHLTHQPQSVGDVPAHIRPHVDAVFARVLAKNPADRFASCGEFVRALGSALAGQGSAPCAPAAAAPGARPARRWGSGLIVAVTTAIVLLIGATAWGLYRLTTDHDAPVVAAASTTTTVPTVTVTSTTRSTTPTVVAEPTRETYVEPTTTTASTPEPYEGMPCTVSEFGNQNSAGTLYCSAVEGTWQDLTNRTHAAVAPGSSCSEPGSRARISGTEAIGICTGSDGDYTWQYP